MHMQASHSGLLGPRTASTLRRFTTQRRGAAACRPLSHRRVVAYSSGNAATTVREAVLCKKFKAHDASTSAALVVTDEPGLKKVITSSLDKTLATWTLEGSDLGGPTVLSQKLEVGAAGPVFALVKPPEKAADAAGAKRGPGDTVFCGLAAKEIAAWEVGKGALDDKVRMNGHTGWVRSLAATGKYLFSCGCNHLRQWDATYPVPKEVAATSLFTGDILAIAAKGGRVVTAGADGSLHTWALGKGGELVAGPAREKAHEGRVTDVLLSGPLVYSVSYDGALKAWDADTLQLVMAVPGAHNGGRIHCLAKGPDGLLYSGGDDNLVRRWDAALLSPVGEPLAVHLAAVRTLAAGKREVLVSGDASGEVAVWTLPMPSPPASAMTSLEEVTAHEDQRSTPSAGSTSSSSGDSSSSNSSSSCADAFLPAATPTTPPSITSSITSSSSNGSHGCDSSGGL